VLAGRRAPADPTAPELVCVVNLSGAPVRVDDYGTLVLTSADLDVTGNLPVDAAAWFERPPVG
jgi:alpha-glucosidase